jgi:energy-coupling factor transporter ATP-binding protein EcfA2
LDKIIYSNFNKEAIKSLKKALTSGEVNPLLIYGPSGSGKSFLVKNMEEEFTGISELVNAKEIDSSLLRGYLNKDLIIIEDIQLLKPSKNSIDTLFEILEHYTKTNYKKIILTADRHPKGINLPDRIFSRIESGVIVPIKDFDEVSKRKVLEILGQGLSGKFLKKLEKLDIRTMSQAIGAIKKVRVLGYVPDEKDRLEEEEKRKEEEEEKKNEEEKKQAGEFEKFIQDVKRGFPDKFVETERAETLRDEYRAKMFVWKMKGFNTDRIKKVIDKNLDLLTGEFVSYTTDIQRLIELQKRYGMLIIENLIKNSIITKEENQEIEEALFNPDKVEWLTKTIGKLEEEEDKMAEQARRKLEVKEKKLIPEEEISKEKINNLHKTLTMDLHEKSFRLVEDF